MKNSLKIAYIINHSTFFASHILPHALAARNNGCNIKLFCGKYSSKSMNIHGMKLIKKHRINISLFNFTSSSLNILKEFFAFIKLLNEIRKFKPDLIHVATPKGQLYGGLISKILKIKCLVIFISGMGYLYSNKLNLFEKVARFGFVFFQKIILRHENKVLIVENKDDFNYFKNEFNLKKKDIEIINGSGVDLKIFKKNFNQKNKIVLFVGRIIEEKGIYEFIRASEILKKKYPDWKFQAAGAFDYLKSSTIDKNLLIKLNKNQAVEFLNFRKNIVNFLKNSAIVCLPSYREGLPKSLCEAAACGIPIVTTNTTGCKDSIIPKKTGELCIPKNVTSLVKKIDLLIKNKKLRIFYSNNALKLAKNKFDVKIISKKILHIYIKLFDEKK